MQPLASSVESAGDRIISRLYCRNGRSSARSPAPSRRPVSLSKVAKPAGYSSAQSVKNNVVAGTLTCL